MHPALSLCPCNTAAGGFGEWGSARALWGAAWPEEYPWCFLKTPIYPGQVFAAKMAAGSLLCKPPFKLEQQEVGTLSGIQLQGELRKWELKAVFNVFAEERSIR